MSPARNFSRLKTFCRAPRFELELVLTIRQLRHSLIARDDQCSSYGCVGNSVDNDAVDTLYGRCLLRVPFEEGMQGILAGSEPIVHASNIADQQGASPSSFSDRHLPSVI